MEVKCELCNKLPARYICKSCGRAVCVACFDHESETCVDCSNLQRAYNVNYERKKLAQVTTLETKLFFLGFALMMIGMLLTSIAPLMTTGFSSSGGIVVFIFPFLPFGIAWGPHGGLAILASLVLMIIMLLIVFVLYGRRW